MNLSPATNGIAAAANALLDARVTATALGYALADTDSPGVMFLMESLNESLEAVRVALGAATCCHELYQHADGDAVDRLREMTNFLRRTE
jgi:hypothetical protein